MNDVVICIGLFVLTMSMFFIGYVIGRMEATHEHFTSEFDIPGDSDLHDAFMEMESRRNEMECISLVPDSKSDLVWNYVDSISDKE